MADKPGYSLRRKSVALTRTQWMAFCVALAVAVVGGPIVALTVGLSAASLVIAPAALAMAMVIAFGRMPE